MSHELDDLIIDEPAGNNKKSKNILSRIALIIIFLIAGIIISKLILSDKGDPNEIDRGNKLGEIIDPTKTDPEIVKLTKDDSFEKRPPIRKDNSKPTKPVQRESESDVNIDDSMIDGGSITFDDNDFGSDYGTMGGASSQMDMGMDDEVTPTHATPTTPQVKQESVKPKPKSQPQHQNKRRAQHQAIQNELSQRAKPTTHQTPAKMSGKYFIQIGSFSKRPADSYLRSIRQKGYTPFIIHSGNLYKVRVGPYNSFQEAKAKLEVVKRALSTDGFVVKRK
jgi:DedD protein